jgi:hypothetical protein
VRDSRKAAHSRFQPTVLPIRAWLATAEAHTFYSPEPGTYVLRARFVGTDYNAPARSKTLSVTVP